MAHECNSIELNTTGHLLEFQYKAITYTLLIYNAAIHIYIQYTHANKPIH